MGRRLILGLLVTGVAGVVAGPGPQNLLADVLGPIERHDPTGLVALLPAGGTFRYYSVAGQVPIRDATSYRLSVSGLVTRSLSLTMADLQDMPQTSLTHDFQCVTGWRVPGVQWSGVRLSDVLDRAAPTSSATALRLGSFDGTYTENLTLAQARRDDVLIASVMQGRPVSHDHGGPIRLYTASMFGYKSIKWLDSIELTDHVERGYWERRGYDLNGIVPT